MTQFWSTNHVRALWRLLKRRLQQFGNSLRQAALQLHLPAVLSRRLILALPPVKLEEGACADDQHQHPDETEACCAETTGQNRFNLRRAVSTSSIQRWTRYDCVLAANSFSVFLNALLFPSSISTFCTFRAGWSCEIEISFCERSHQKKAFLFVVN